MATLHYCKAKMPRVPAGYQDASILCFEKQKALQPAVEHSSGLQACTIRMPQEGNAWHNPWHSDTCAAWCCQQIVSAQQGEVTIATTQYFRQAAA